MTKSLIPILCEKCKCEIEYYDTVQRTILKANHEKQYIKIKRYRCPRCGSIHRILPDNVLPYKQYDAEIIEGVKEGLIDSTTLGYEDYPSEMTMKRWRKPKNKK